MLHVSADEQLFGTFDFLASPTVRKFQKESAKIQTTNQVVIIDCGRKYNCFFLKWNNFCSCSNQGSKIFSFGEISADFQRQTPITTIPTISSSQSKPLFNENFVPNNPFPFSTNTVEFSFEKTTTLPQTKTTDNNNNSNILRRPANFEKETNVLSENSTTATSASTNVLSTSETLNFASKSTFSDIFSHLSVQKTKTNVPETNKSFVSEKQFGNFTSSPQPENVPAASTISSLSQSLTYERILVITISFLLIEEVKLNFSLKGTSKNKTRQLKQQLQ